jgi:hypothetical protein
MNFETLAIETQNLLTKEEVAATVEQTAEVTPISMDCFKLVGGGSAIFLFD